MTLFFGFFLQYFIMIKFLLLSVLVFTSIATPARKDCLSGLTITLTSLKKAISMELSNDKIDALTNVLNQIPQTLNNCFGENIQGQFTHEVPGTCIADMNKAAKIGLRLQNEKDNQLLYAKDLILLERLFQTKMKKDCPFMTGMTLQDLKDKATCMEDSYRLSLVVQKFIGDLGRNDKKAAVHDMDIIFSTLPNVLDTCGQHEWADEVRKYLPMNCVHAIQDFIGELAVLQHHYTHFEWLVKNYKDVQAYVAMIKMHCPFANKF